MTKKELRIIIWNKYKGHCAYCGKPIVLQDMQVDHLFPKCMENWIITAQYKPEFKKEYNLPTDVNCLENLMPSCRRCNHYKRGELLENFRLLMQTIHERIRKDYICKVAEDYGIIKLKPFDGVFYFEKSQK